MAKLYELPVVEWGVPVLMAEVYHQQLPGFCAVVVGGWDQLIWAPMVWAVQEQFQGVIVPYMKHWEQMSNLEMVG